MPETARATAGAQRYDVVKVTDGVPVTQQRRRLRAAEAEYRLVWVTGEQRELCTGGQHPHQQGGLRIELLRIVNQQNADAGALGRQQVGIDGKCFECGPDQFGRAHCRSRRLRSCRPDGRAQQHHLFVVAREPAGGRPFGTT